MYFDVTNSYVLHKLKIILFPFLIKEDNWKRGQGSFDSTDSVNFGAAAQENADGVDE